MKISIGFLLMLITFGLYCMISEETELTTQKELEETEKLLIYKIKARDVLLKKISTYRQIEKKLDNYQLMDFIEAKMKVYNLSIEINSLNKHKKALESQLIDLGSSLSRLVDSDEEEEDEFPVIYKST